MVKRYHKNHYPKGNGRHGGHRQRTRSRSKDHKRRQPQYFDLIGPTALDDFFATRQPPSDLIGPTALDYFFASQGLQLTAESAELWQGTPGNAMDKARKRLHIKAIQVWRQCDQALINQIEGTETCSTVDLREHVLSKTGLYDMQTLQNSNAGEWKKCSCFKLVMKLRSENVTIAQLKQTFEEFWANRSNIFNPKTKKAVAKERFRLEQLKLKRESADIDNAASSHLLEARAEYNKLQLSIAAENDKLKSLHCTIVAAEKQLASLQQHLFQYGQEEMQLAKEIRGQKEHLEMMRQEPSAASQAVEDYVADVTACHLDSEDATETLSWRCLRHGIDELPAHRSCDAVCPRCQVRLVRTAPPNLSEDDESMSESGSDPSTSTA